MVHIKFGTDGWRAIIGDEFTIENLKRISYGTARYMVENKLKKVVIGYDTRFSGWLFCQTVACVLADEGIEVLIDKNFITTPMISLACRELNADLGVVITASHNPPEYNGFKLKSPEGGPADGSILSAVEKLIPEQQPLGKQKFIDHVHSGQIVYYDFESLYLNQIHKHFNVEKLQEMSSSLAYDSMFGAGQNIMKKLFPKARHLHAEINPGFQGIPPEPIERNLSDLKHFVTTNKHIEIGLANDGDADRIGLFDENGNFLDAHHIMLLTLYYLAKYKNQSGKVVISMASSEKIGKLAETFGFETQFTKIGFKHITPIILKENVIMGGEEAGGISAIGHIPERDGIWIGLLIMELLSLTGKKLSELVQTIYGLVGHFSYDRSDLKLPEEKKKQIMALCSAGHFKEIAGRPIMKTLDTDGYKFYLADDVWLMIRPSGTEPVLRLYAQAATKEDLEKLMTESKAFLLN